MLSSKNSGYFRPDTGHNLNLCAGKHATVGGYFLSGGGARDGEGFLWGARNSHTNAQKSAAQITVSHHCSIGIGNRRMSNHFRHPSFLHKFHKEDGS
jgi:hypothetical protein